MSLAKVRKIAIVGVMGLVSLTLLALTSGPETSTDADWVTGDDGITHDSRVHYTTETNPFVAEVDRVYFGGRPAGNLLSVWFGADWRRDPTLYKVWNGSAWVTDHTVNKGPWRGCGDEDDGLCWWTLNNDVTLEDSARVDQRLRYRYFFYVWTDEIAKTEWPGRYHKHYLE